MVHILLKLNIFLVLLTSILCDERVHYDGYSVLRLMPKTRSQLDYLHNLAITTTDLDFWTFPASLNKSVDVMVGPDLKSHFLSELSTRNIEQSEMIADPESLINKQRMEKTAYKSTFRSEAVPQFWSAFPTLDEVFDFLAQINQQNQLITEVEVIGKSYENRDLRLLKIGANLGHSQIIFIDSAIHAREWVAPTTTTYFAQQLVDGYNNNDPIIRPLVERFDWYILPVSNPDGFSFTHTNNRLWRKTRSPNIGSTCIGTDPNRNFNFQWNTTGSSSNPCSETYSGYQAFSEPETKALSDYITAFRSRIVAYFPIHSYGQLFMYAWGYTTVLPPDVDNLLAKATVAVNALTAQYGTAYRVGSSANILYTVSGGARDWGYSSGVNYSYTLELRDTGSYGFLLPTDQIIPTAIETSAAFLAIANSI